MILYRLTSTRQNLRNLNKLAVSAGIVALRLFPDLCLEGGKYEL